MLLANDEVVIVLVPADDDELLPKGGNEVGRDVGSITMVAPSLDLIPDCNRVGAVLEWVDVKVVPEVDTRLDANDTLAPLTS